MTYKEAYDKIIQAYFRDEINPLDADFCFCGTLSPNRGEWRDGFMGFSWGRKKPEYSLHFYNHYEPYSLWEYKQMEWALIDAKNISEGNKEDNLFAGMVAALEVLKQIHLSRGKNVDDVGGLEEFKKRELVNQ